MQITKMLMACLLFTLLFALSSYAHASGKDSAVKAFNSSNLYYQWNNDCDHDCDHDYNYSRENNRYGGPDNISAI